MNKNILSQISNLSETERSGLYKVIEEYIFQSKIDIAEEEVAQRAKGGYCCPNCKSIKTRKNGKEHGVQRFVCNECKKNFRASTGLVTAHLKKKNKLKDYIPHLLEGYSIRKCAELVGISIQTSFDWRHKILTALGAFQENIKFNGVLEADELYFDQSSKGQKIEGRESRKRGKSISLKKKRGISNEKVAVIAGTDRSGNKLLKVSTVGRISKEDVRTTFKDKVKEATVLCTDGHRSYVAFAKENDLDHQTVKVSAKQYVKNGKYHVQHANQTTSDLRKWMDKFNGVSTKYLQNYMNWYIVKRAIEKASNPVVSTIALIVSSNNAYDTYNKIENAYNILIGT